MVSYLSLAKGGLSSASENFLCVMALGKSLIGSAHRFKVGAFGPD
jgi:hypothetical protein